MIDVLHTCDQGVASHVIGNVLHECCELKVFAPGGTLEQNVAALDTSMAAWYKANRVTSKVQGKLTKEGIRASGQWPKLKAKAAATRHLAPFALQLAQAHLGARQRAICQLLCEFYSLLDTQGMFLDDAAKDRFPKLGFRLCGLFAQQAAEAYAAGRKQWKMSPKVHLLLHLLEWQAPSTGINPRFFWVYADEDMVGLMVEVAQSCHPTTMPATAMTKWLQFAFEEI